VWERIFAGPRPLVVVAASAAALVLLTTTGQAVLSGSSSLSDYSVVTQGDRDAFAWLSAHSRAGERVLNDEEDGSVWAYVLTGGRVDPLFGPRPTGGFHGVPEFESRLHLQATVQDIDSDTTTRSEAREWNVRYVLVGARLIPDGDLGLRRDALRTSRSLRLVYASGGAEVYEIVGA
jgi:hypothetical protein